jgi:glutathione S-transferase
MKLLYSPTSPYARKVRIVVREKGLQSSVTEIIRLPADKQPELLAANPLGKVPALILDDHSVLFDSPVICEYLDQLVKKPGLIPAGDARWPAFRAQALADGLLDVAVAAVLESRRPQERQSDSMLAHWREQMLSAVRHMHEELASLESELTVGHIALATALAYLDFRHSDLQWRTVAGHALADWYAGFARRPSMQKTAPPA